MEEKYDDEMFDLINIPDFLLDEELGDDWDKTEQILINVLDLNDFGIVPELN